MLTSEVLSNTDLKYEVTVLKLLWLKIPPGFLRWDSTYIASDALSPVSLALCILQKGVTSQVAPTPSLA